MHYIALPNINRKILFYLKKPINKIVIKIIGKIIIFIPNSFPSHSLQLQWKG